MSTEPVQPQPGRRPVYPVDSDADATASRSPSGVKKGSPPVGQSPESDDPASDANTESANHPNDDE